MRFVFEGAGKIQGEKTNLTTEEVVKVELDYYVEFESLFCFWFHVKPGVTGYESYEFKPDSNSDIKSKGWSACSGTPGSWDRLWISPEEMTKAITDMENQIHEFREAKEVRQICTVGADYLGLPIEACKRPYNYMSKALCGYYRQNEDDPDHPSELPKYCGNCIHWIVLEPE